MEGISRRNGQVGGNHPSARAHLRRAVAKHSLRHIHFGKLSTTSARVEVASNLPTCLVGSITVVSLWTPRMPSLSSTTDDRPEAAPDAG